MSKQPLISSQATIGGLALLGSITPIILVIVKAKKKIWHDASFARLKFIANIISELPQPILQVEVGIVLLLLLLNEVRVAKYIEKGQD